MKKTFSISSVLFFFIVLFPLFFFTAAFNKPVLKEFKIAGFAQGTTYHITYYAADSFVTKKMADSILNKLDSSLSIYKTYSLISQFNNTEKSIEMDAHVGFVVQRSLNIFRQTNGISDITVFPLVNAWGFGPQRVSAQPDSNDIKNILPCVGSGKLHIAANHLFKDLPCVKIDVNGIAQGYSVDVIACFLEEKGVKDYLVEIGGELRIKGYKQPFARKFQIGIEAPADNRFDEPILQKIVELDKGAITTSGNYRKYHSSGGKTVAHLMDPTTGYPFQNEMISATVYAKDAITADGYDNALMGMGLKNALQFLKHHKSLQAYFIYRNENGVISDTATKGFYKLFKK